MEWLTAVKQSLEYIEENIHTIEGPEEVSKHVNMSSMYLQRGFQVMTGYTVGEYIRNRKMYLAAMDIVRTNEKIIDIAFDYGYETPESFTKAFTRFHGVAPTVVKKDRREIKPFMPLQIKLVVNGGDKMNYEVEKMESFKVIGFVREFEHETAMDEIPKFWQEIFTKYMRNIAPGKEPVTDIEKAVVENGIGSYGVCIDNLGPDRFNYMVAGIYKGGNVPEEMEVHEIPSKIWAKFKCVGPNPETLQSMNLQIWNDWLPGNPDYELSDVYNIEWYSPEGNMSDSGYKSEIWLPVKTKEV